MSLSLSALVAALAVIASPGSLAAAPFELLYSHPIGDDEDSRFATFLGKGVLMLGEWDQGLVGEARVYEADSGAFKFALDCPPFDPYIELCPRAVAASGRLFAVLSSHKLHVFGRDGGFLRTIEPPDQPPLDYHAFGSTLAVRGRRIAVAGPHYQDGVVVAGAVVYLFDGVTGMLLRQSVIASPEILCHVSLAFVGRRLVVGTPGCSSTSEPGRVSAFDSSTGALLWSRTAPEPETGDHFGEKLAALGSDVVAGPGAHRLDGRTGALEQSYLKPGGGTYTVFDDIAASGSRVAVASHPPSAVHIFSAHTGALIRIVDPPSEPCDVFGTNIGLGPSRLLATEGSYCGPGSAFVFQLP